jgi:hypothetical protein
LDIVRFGRASVLLVIFLKLLELGFCFAQQFFDRAATRRIGNGLEQIAVMLNIFPLDKTLQSAKYCFAVELDQCDAAQFIEIFCHGK